MLKTNEAAARFGSRAALAKALGINRAAVTLWGEYVPQSRAIQLQEITSGALQAGEYPAGSRPGKYAPRRPRKR